MITLFIILIDTLASIIAIVLLIKKKKIKFLFISLLFASLFLFLVDESSIPYKSRNIDYCDIAKTVVDYSITEEAEQEDILGHNGRVAFPNFSPNISLNDDMYIYFNRFEFKNEKEAEEISKFILTNDASRVYLSSYVYNRERLVRINENTNLQTKYFQNIPKNWCYLVYQDENYTIYSTYTTRKRYSWDHLAFANLPFGGDDTLLSIQNDQYVYLVHVFQI